jgi:hypothetical protein
MKLVFILLLFIPQLSFALDFYTQADACKTIDKDNPILIKDTTYPFPAQGSSNQRVIKNKQLKMKQKVKNLMLRSTEERLRKQNIESVIVGFMSIKIKNQNLPNQRLIGHAKFYPASSCNSTLKISTKNIPLNTRYTEFKDSSSKRIHTLSINLIKPYTPPSISVSEITKDSFYGLSLGMGKKEVEKATHGFHLDIQINTTTSMHVINRNHALFFQEDILIGYEYGRNLMPMLITNKLPLSEISPVFNSALGKISIDNDGLSKREINEIKAINDSASFIKIKQYSSGEVKTHLSSFTFGKTSNFNLEIPKSSCLDTNILLTEAQNKIGNNYFFRFNINKSEIGYLTSCNQLITFKHAELSRIVLVEEINTKSASLNILDSLFSNITNWQFLNVEKEMSESQVVEKLNIDDAYMMNDILEFSNDNWQGYFTFNEDKVISAELSYFSSDE